MRRVIILLFILLPASVGAQSYLWPTDASHYLTSSFGEFRTRHFHAGLDIKSWNTPGYKVFAIDDGYLWRVRTSNTGYGKVLYQKLRDGRIAVYAHLDRFADPIDEFVYNRQIEIQSYETDFFPNRDQFPVKKGEVIAYTGNTGTRYPHLHFEIRSEDNKPVNPLLLGLDVQDKVPPTPQELVVTPLESNSTINGNFFLQMPALRKEGPHHYVADPVTVSGEFGLELKAYDGVSAVYNKYSIYAAELTWQDSILFRFQYDQFSFSDSRLIMMERNYPLQREGLGRFQRLYKTQHTKNLPFYPPELTGRITLPVGEHTLNLSIRDFYGNETNIDVPVTVVEDKPVSANWTMKNGHLICSLIHADSNAVNHLTVRTADGNIFAPDSVSITPNSAQLFFRHNSDHNPGYVLRLDDSDKRMSSAFPYSKTPDALHTFAKFDWIYTPRGMIALAEFDQPFYEPLQLDLLHNSSDTTIVFHTSDLRRWNTPPLSTELLKEATIVVGTPTRVLRILPDNFIVAQNQRESILTNRDGSAELHILDNSLYNPSLIWYEEQEAPNDEFFTPIWRYHPRAVPFEEPAQIRLHLPDVQFPKRQLGIYYTEEEEEWNYLPAEFARDSTMLVGEILSLESFSLRRDSLPPEIYIRKPDPDGASVSPGLERLEFTVRDVHSGIPSGKSIQLLVDGDAVIFEFNPITKILTYRFRHSLSKGSYTIQIAASDAAGNHSKKSYMFTVQ